jgi:alkylhydroperoxidase family enzyme
VVEAVFADIESAPVSDEVKAGLRLVEALTLRPDEMTVADIEAARAAGLTDEAIRDAGMVCTMFSTITRLADSLDFRIPDSFEGAAKTLTSKMGYRLPPPVLLLPRK